LEWEYNGHSNCHETHQIMPKEILEAIVQATTTRSTMKELKNGKRKRRRKHWRCEVNGKYDFKRVLYLFSWEGRRIDMVPPKVTPQLPKPETCEEIICFNDDEDVKDFNCELKTDFECVINLNVSDLDYGRVKKYEGFRVDVKHKSIKDTVRHEVLDIVEALDIENSKVSYFQTRGIHVVETKVNVVRDWSSPKTLPEVRSNKVANVFQEKDELKYVEPLEGEAKQVIYVI
nr:hypothetical protein [Tanacetum cinerariifolium]